MRLCYLLLLSLLTSTTTRITGRAIKASMKRIPKPIMVYVSFRVLYNPSIDSECKGLIKIIQRSLECFDASAILSTPRNSYYKFVNDKDRKQAHE